MNILDKLQKDGLLFDGGMGTSLFAAGLQSGDCVELWNVEKPSVLEDIHTGYIKAGANVICTNTFGANGFKLKKAGYENRLEEFNTAAAAVARKSAGSNVYVAGDIGPTGEMLYPSGTLTAEDSTECFSKQARILEDAGVDLFIVETFFDLNEIKTAIEGIKKVSSKPIFATMTFQQMKSGFFTIMGNKPADCMQSMLEFGADVVGANCSMASDTMIEIAQIIRDCTDSPVLIQPNAGVPSMVDGKTVYPESAEYFSANMLKIKELGINAVGGCCGTTPEFIQAIHQKLM